MVPTAEPAGLIMAWCEKCRARWEGTMAVLKQHLTPIGRGKAAKIVKHVGKGATEQNLPGAAQGGYANTINDYSQATPMANPSPAGMGSGQPDTTGFP